MLVRMANSEVFPVCYSNMHFVNFSLDNIRFEDRKGSVINLKIVTIIVKGLDQVIFCLKL